VVALRDEVDEAPDPLLGAFEAGLAFVELGVRFASIVAKVLGDLLSKVPECRRRRVPVLEGAQQALARDILA
jgi:hypothetical protein